MVLARLAGSSTKGGLGYFEAIVKPDVKCLANAGHGKESARADETIAKKFEPERTCQQDQTVR